MQSVRNSTQLGYLRSYVINLIAKHKFFIYSWSEVLEVFDTLKEVLSDLICCGDCYPTVSHNHVFVFLVTQVEFTKSAPLENQFRLTICTDEQVFKGVTGRNQSSIVVEYVFAFVEKSKEH